MKINYMKIKNIGPYYGEHTFNLNTSSYKNIILIGGKNGAGKTSFLKAIKYGLFGCFAMGLKTETTTYLTEIESLINNKAKNSYSIEIEFEYIENYATNKYVIIRSWKKIENGLKEKLAITLNDYLLDELETKEVMDKLKAITNPNLINSFIFDGEKISQIIESGNVSQYLKEMFNSIFCIDLIDQTEKDLQNYLTKKSEENNSKEQVESITLLNKINSLKSQIKLCENDIDTFIATKNNLMVMKSSVQNEFYVLGGLTKNEQISLNEKMYKYNKEKELMSKVLKDYLESDMALYLNIDLLTDGQAQIVKEKQAAFPGFLVELESFINEDLTELKNKVKNMVEDCEIIHKLSYDSITKVENRIVDIMASTSNVREYLSKRISNFDEYKQMQKSIINNDSIEKINTLIKEMKKIDLSIQEISNQINEYETRLKVLKSDFDTYFKIYEAKNDEIKKNTLYDSSFILASDSLTICEKYAQALTKSKLKKVSKVALNIFNDTIRKEDFISKLKINENFELLLYNYEEKLIDPKILSAGEMQILVSSLIWSMFKVSGRREMFIFDTPLARLDKENRLTFINKIISTISSQIVILSTDSEFIGENLNAIENRIYKKYLLNYDVKTSTTSVDESYFGGI